MNGAVIVTEFPLGQDETRGPGCGNFLITLNR